MTSSTLRIQQKSFPVQQPDNYCSQYKLQWRQGQLFVRTSQAYKQLYMQSIESQPELVKCLKNSPVRLVRLDTTLGEVALKSWVKACEEAKKPVFLWQTVEQKQQRKPIKVSWNVKLMDLIVSFLLLILLSPVIFAVSVLQSYAYSPKSIFTREWRVGSRGRLFQAFRFRTTKVNNDTKTTALGEWLGKYKLDKLPQLLNILRGEMSLFGLPTLKLSEAVESGSEEGKHSSLLSWQKLTAGYVAEA